MKYSGTYRCGHEGTVQLYGDKSYREWKNKCEFEGLCPACAEIETAERSARLKEKAEELGFPELVGSEKQVAWALVIRDEYYKAVDNYIAQYVYGEDKCRYVCEHMFANMRSCRWWIDNRTFSISVLVKYYMQQYGSKIRADFAAETEQQDEVAQEAREERMISPEDPHSDAAAEIAVAANAGDPETGEIRLRYDRDDAFRKIVRDHGYEWDKKAYCWARSISKHSGPIVDRAAEIGIALLAAGFRVVVFDDAVYNKVEAGEYAPECRRWVGYDGEKLYLTYPYDERLSALTGRIKGARWNGEKRRREVPVSSYSEVEELADLYEFAFVDSARSAIEAYKARLVSSSVITPDVREQDDKPDPLKEILKSSRDIIDDLKDE